MENVCERENEFSLVDIAERFNYVFDENGDMIVWRGKK